MTDPKLFQLTDDDKVKYLALIEDIDVNHTTSITKLLGIKLKNILDSGNLNIIEANLINDMALLMGVLEMNPDLPKLIVKKILFAMTYFVDENDEIPDIIPIYGYLDDITVAEWVMNDIKSLIPPISES
ncbi:MAG: DUF1232 domain-containing protein [Candidatus Marinimicrobia bacterium]|jgi:hypothetical protein|nr:DUF1232 domain-containing protein [Candidatus Neomarinimicrobiota bacterium]MBT3501206.1 DUF1232 domain-containing protein [Candidatus Neomarinimicrobiota bacterium]MBT3839488.1 DUF1232 domain-containing protein [Candidatus Neomarinimicrobiota bacterium]MBT3999388.1 DUF1232 domain-containing protein [Candidatus Neomarinimicrobiota bacterium]MBT4282011.1 DUF1232 domain-containing protein [Candidatus Neomarinimicrobiota bacterium]